MSSTPMLTQKTPNRRTFKRVRRFCVLKCQHGRFGKPGSQDLLFGTSAGPGTLGTIALARSQFTKTDPCHCRKPGSPDMRSGELPHCLHGRNPQKYAQFSHPGATRLLL